MSRTTHDLGVHGQDDAFLQVHVEERAATAVASEVAAIRRAMTGREHAIDVTAVHRDAITDFVTVG